MVIDVTPVGVVGGVVKLFTSPGYHIPPIKTQATK